MENSIRKFHHNLSPKTGRLIMLTLGALSLAGCGESTRGEQYQGRYIGFLADVKHAIATSEAGPAEARRTLAKAEALATQIYHYGADSQLTLGIDCALTKSRQFATQASESMYELRPTLEILKAKAEKVVFPNGTPTPAEIKRGK